MARVKLNKKFEKYVGTIPPKGSRFFHHSPSSQATKWINIYLDEKNAKLMAYVCVCHFFVVPLQPQRFKDMQIDWRTALIVLFI
jgi:hypothetical protein